MISREAVMAIKDGGLINHSLITRVRVKKTISDVQYVVRLNGAFFDNTVIVTCNYHIIETHMYF